MSVTMLSYLRHRCSGAMPTVRWSKNQPEGERRPLNEKKRTFYLQICAASVAPSDPSYKFVNSRTFFSSQMCPRGSISLNVVHCHLNQNVLSLRWFHWRGDLSKWPVEPLIDNARPFCVTLLAVVVILWLYWQHSAHYINGRWKHRFWFVPSC